MLSYILWTGLIALLISIFLLKVDQKIDLPRPYILVGSGICFVLSLCFPPALLFMDTTAAFASIVGVGLLLAFAAPRAIEKNLDRFKWLEKASIPKTWSDRANRARLQHSRSVMNTRTSAFLKTAAKAVRQFTAKTGASLAAVLKTTALALSGLIDKLKIDKLKEKAKKAEEPAVSAEAISTYENSPLIEIGPEPADDSPAVPELVVEETAVDTPALEEEAQALSEAAASVETTDADDTTLPTAEVEEVETVSDVSVVDTTSDTAVDSGEIESGEVKTARPGVESEPEEPSDFQSDTDNYSGGEYMANEKLSAASAPRERRPLGELINNGFDAKEQGRWEEAINLFRQALEINRHPDLSVLLVLEISCLYRDKGCYQPAVDIMQSFLNLYSGSLDKANLDKIRNEMFYIETVYGLLQQSGTPDLPSSKIPRLIKIKAEELYQQRKGMAV